ncbi:hypothetical protein PGB90_004450 [Kerria lacca]
MTERSTSKSWRESKRLLLIVVTIALFTEEILVSVVVFVVPRYLREIQENSLKLNQIRNDGSSINSSITNSITGTTNVVANNLRLLNSTNEFEFYINENKFQMIGDEFPSNVLRNNSSNIKFTDTQNKNDNMQNSMKIGILLGAKSFTQLVANFFVGPITQKVDYNKPMFLGFIILFLSTLVFAFSTTYEMLLFTRSFQGIGASCTSIAGKSAVSSRYADSAERDNALRIAVAGSITGLMSGPPLGAFMYQYFGKPSPFLTICGLTFINGGLQLLMKPLKKCEQKEKAKGDSILILIQDPYIIFITAGTFLNCVGYALLETSLPLWIMDTMNTSQTELGTVFIPTGIGLLSVFLIFGKFCLKMGRWQSAMLGMIITATSLLGITFTKSIFQLYIPNFTFGVGLAMASTALTPQLAHIVDIRHNSSYANAFAIYDFFLVCGLALGPICAGFFVKYVGFYWAMYGVSISYLIYALLVYFLRKSPEKNIKSVRLFIFFFYSIAEQLPEEKSLNLHTIKTHPPEIQI